MATTNVKSHYRRSTTRKIRTKNGTSYRTVKGGTVRSHRRRK